MLDQCDAPRAAKSRDACGPHRTRRATEQNDECGEYTRPPPCCRPAVAREMNESSLPTVKDDQPLPPVKLAPSPECSLPGSRRAVCGPGQPSHKRVGEAAHRVVDEPAPHRALAHRAEVVVKLPRHVAALGVPIAAPLQLAHLGQGEMGWGGLGAGWRQARARVLRMGGRPRAQQACAHMQLSALVRWAQLQNRVAATRHALSQRAAAEQAQHAGGGRTCSMSASFTKSSRLNCSWSSLNCSSDRAQQGARVRPRVGWLEV